VGNFSIDLLTECFGGDAPQQPLALGQVAARAAVVYLLGLLLVRVGKSRFHGRASAIDIVLGFVLGSLLSRGITGSASISGTFVASAALTALHWAATAAACRSHGFGNLVKGHAKLVVDNGRLVPSAMRSSHISEHDIREAMRLAANIDDLGQVKAAYKERSGLISIVTYPAANKEHDPLAIRHA
jgi:uncharacterized membrane protein YcaP (DUF421 family)